MKQEPPFYDTEVGEERLILPKKTPDFKTEKEVRDSMCDYWYEKGKKEAVTEYKKDLLEKIEKNVEKIVLNNFGYKTRGTKGEKIGAKYILDDIISLIK